MSTIEKNNLLIAEFMGADMKQKYMYIPEHRKAVIYNDGYGWKHRYQDRFPADELQYHYEWNWLMPVVIKAIEIDPSLSEVKIGTPISEVYELIINIIKKQKS